MKIGIISDIHSNYDALIPVMEFLKSSGCELVYCLGDMMGYYDQPNEVIDCLRVNQVVSVKGNHDQYILGRLKYKIENEHIYGIKRHQSILTCENRFYIEVCEDMIDVQLEGKRLLLCHAFPGQPEKYIYSLESFAPFENPWDGYDAYFYGHTHIPYYSELKNCKIVNPGSVGQPRDYDRDASCVIYNLKNNHIEFCRVQYPVENLQKRLKMKGYHQQLINILTREKER